MKVFSSIVIIFYTDWLSNYVLTFTSGTGSFVKGGKMTLNVVKSNKNLNFPKLPKESSPKKVTGLFCSDRVVAITKKQYRIKQHISKILTDDLTFKGASKEDRLHAIVNMIQVLALNLPPSKNTKICLLSGALIESEKDIKEPLSELLSDQTNNTVGFYENLIKDLPSWLKTLKPIVGCPVGKIMQEYSVIRELSEKKRVLA